MKPSASMAASVTTRSIKGVLLFCFEGIGFLTTTKKYPWSERRNNAVLPEFLSSSTSDKNFDLMFC